MLFNNNEQKSPARRFLLILGVVGFVCVITLALMVIFWDAMLPNISKTQRIVFGLVLIAYGVLRFSRLLKKKPDNEV
jgi:threonine/homoserine/homoserine lactone efflux protein